MKKRILTIIGTIFAVTLLTACGKTEIDLNKYASFEVEGYDGMGKAQPKFDFDAFVNDYKDVVKVKNEKDNADLSLAINVETPVEAMYDLDYVDFDHTSSEGLSNGDKVTFHWTCNDEGADKFFNSKLVYSDIEYTINELQAIESFDPFDGVEVSFSGIDGSGKAEIAKKPDNGLNYSISPDSDLSVGDTVTVTAGTNNLDAYIQQNGKAPNATEKTYTVEALDSYSLSAADITADMVKSIDTIASVEAKDNLDAKLKSNKDLRNEMEKVDILWKVGGGIDGDIKLSRLVVGTAKNAEDGNIMLAVYAVPYKLEIESNNGSSKVSVGDLVGQGEVYVIIPIEDSIAFSDGEFAAGKSGKREICASLDEVNAAIESYKSDYTLEEYKGL